MDTWFVVFRDGSWEYRGKGIPEGLEALLLDRREKADLETVTLGPSGEFDLLRLCSFCRLLSIYPANCVSSLDILPTQLLSIL